MLFVYPAVFHKEDDAYWVEFPDLEGCHTFNTTLTETVASATEALEGYLLCLLDEGASIPKPSDIAKIAPVSDGFVSLVSCNLDPYRDTKAVKKTLTIPAWLNDRAVTMGVNFSQVLQDALLAKVQG